MPIKAETNAQILLKQPQNNFEKVQKTIFLPLKLLKNYPLKPPKWDKYLTKNLNFWGHLSTFQAKNTPKSWPLRPKRILKHLLNNSETTLRCSRKRLFWPQKWSNMTPQNQFLDQTSRLSSSFINHLNCPPPPV